jgi:hypothetical protein
MPVRFLGSSSLISLFNELFNDYINKIRELAAKHWKKLASVLEAISAANQNCQIFLAALFLRNEGKYNCQYESCSQAIIEAKTLC